MTARRFPSSLVALYAGPGRQVGVLLRHTLAPLPEERPTWLAETEEAVRAVAGTLGVTAQSLVVLQWRPPEDVVRVARDWRCVWIGDRDRHGRLVRAAERRVADDSFVADLAEAEAAAPTEQADDVRRRLVALPLARPDSSLADPWPGLAEWYRDMARCWLDLGPATRQRLVLRTQEWTAEHILRPSAAPARIAHDLYPVLLRCVPPDEHGFWQPWINLVTSDLTGATAVPPPHRDEAWARRVLLIPYSLPTPRPRGRAVASRSAPAPA